MRSFAIEEPGSPVPALYATLGVVNVWGGECLGGERLTIVPEIREWIFPVPVPELPNLIPAHP